MNLKIIENKAILSSSSKMHCIIAEKGQTFTSQVFGPKVKVSINQVFKNLDSEKLKASWEFINSEGTPIAIIPFPQKKGLDNLELLRMAAGECVKLAENRSLDSISIIIDKAKISEYGAIMDGVDLALYQYSKYKSKKNPTTLNKIFLAAENSVIKQLQTLSRQMSIISQSVNLGRDLVNEPGSELVPQVFVQKARTAARSLPLKVKVRDFKQLVKEKFNGLVTVGKGSPHKPCMVTLSYQGDKAKNAPHLAFVGKGVTFDTGGISLKPGSRMWEMKCDMAGAASALAAITAIARLKPKINVSAILVLAENRPGSGSVLPGDIFKAKNGKTVMVDNTDAEGRLILSDGLYEAGRVGATHIIDLATLTGSIVRALGPSIAGLFSNDENLARQIISIGAQNGEKFWEMPLEEEYTSYLDDTTADLKNVGKVDGGAITAALFLKEFLPPKAKWCHLDIAGTAFTSSNWKYFTPGATGWGIKTLVGVAMGFKK